MPGKSTTLALVVEIEKEATAGAVAKFPRDHPHTEDEAMRLLDGLEDLVGPENAVIVPRAPHPRNRRGRDHC